VENTITEVQITTIKPKDGLLAFASVVLNNDIFLGSIGIYCRPHGGYRLTYPTRKFLNVYHPINSDISKIIEDAVISKYEELIS